MPDNDFPSTQVGPPPEQIGRPDATLAVNAGQLPRSKSVAVGEGELAKMLNVSVRRIRSMNTAGQLPRPLVYRESLWWSTSEITAWIGAGRPDRATWQQMQGVRL